MGPEKGPEKGFGVWAPRADRVELAIEERRVRLERADAGWWRTDVVDAVPGTEYAFVLDRGPAFPDPRSAFQPHGVEGPSMVIDHGAFRWGDDGWSPPSMADAVIYELHVGTFSAGGRFVDVAERLDHVVDLGVTHIELMPVASFPGRYGWGYDGVALFAPHAGYGHPDDLRRLVDAAHGAGLAVLLDVVYNHLGPEGNHLGRFGPYFTDTHRTPWGDAVNLDASGSDEVRRFVVDNATMWLRDYHLDGLRLDAVHALRDDSAVHLLEQLAAEVDALEHALGRPKVLIAETDRNDPRTVAPRSNGGWGIDAQWADDLHHALHVALTGEHDSYYGDFEGLTDVAAALQRFFVFDGGYSPVRGRVHGRPVTDFDLGRRPGDRFVTALQNHDQIGNRLHGDRTNHLVSIDRYLVGATLALAAPTVPMLFQGEEWASSSPFLFFADYADADVAEAVRSGRMREFEAFGWTPSEVSDPLAAHTFERSKLVWSEVDAGEHRRVLDHYRSLLRLRREHLCLHDGRPVDVVEVDETRKVLVFRRGELVVAANLGPEEVVVERVSGVHLAGGDGPTEVLLVTNPATHIGSRGLELAPDSAAVVRPAAPRGHRRG